MTRAGGDYPRLVREHQPTLLHDLALRCDPPTDRPVPPLLDRREVCTLEQGHGRTDDRRHLLASTDLTGDRDWPGVAQVCRLEPGTLRVHGGNVASRTATCTMISPACRPPRPMPRLLALKRGHWPIEPRLHRAKDVALGEDRSLIHLRAGPTVMRRLRDTALGLRHGGGCRTSTSRRALADRPALARAVALGEPLLTHNPCVNP